MKSLSVALGAVAALSSLASAGNFFASCDETWYIERGSSWMHARCWGSGGVKKNSRLNLDWCIGNNDGQMIAQNNGNFHGSCSDCLPDQYTDRAPSDFELPPGITIPSLWYNSDVLQCNCVRKDGSVNLGTTIGLNEFVGNENGILVCGERHTPSWRMGIEE